MKKYKGLGSYNLPTEDLRQIANFHAIVRNYIKMSRLLKTQNKQIAMAHTYKHKAIGRVRAGLSIDEKDKLYINRIDNRHNFFDDREVSNKIKYKTRKYEKI